MNPKPPFDGVFPSEQVDSIVHFGVDLVNWEKKNCWNHSRNVVLVESDPLQIHDLQKYCSGNESTQVFGGVVSVEQQGSAQLYLCNVPRFSSVREPTGLRELIPNLDIIGKAIVEVVDPGKIVLNAGIRDKETNWLIVAMPGLELELLEKLQAAKQLSAFSCITVYAGKYPLYQHGASIVQIADFLVKHEYQLVSVFKDEDPDYPAWQFSKNSYATLFNESRIIISELKQDLERTKESLIDKQQEIQKLISLLEKQQKRIDLNSQKSEELKQKLGSLQDSIDSKLQMQIEKGISNSTKQIESFLTIEHFFNTGTLIPNMHGWAISPDIGCYLVQLILGNQYDAVIEFGGGASTFVMAKTLQILTGSELNSNEFATPSKLISFDHDAGFCSETQSKLIDAELDGYVDVVLAPLTEWRSSADKKFSYYDCFKSLEVFANRMSASHSKVLAFVDGPPGGTGPHARYPALPILLDSINFEQLDIVLDDFAREEEVAIVEMWEELLRSRDFEYRKIEEKFEKGACLLRIGKSNSGLR